MPRLLNREEIEGCVSHVEGYASSGLSVQAYASAHGLEARKLQAWTTHARRRRARLSAIESSPQPPVAGQWAKALCVSCVYPTNGRCLPILVAALTCGAGCRCCTAAAPNLAC